MGLIAALLGLLSMGPAAAQGARSESVSASSMTRRAVTNWAASETWGADSASAAVDAAQLQITVPADATWHTALTTVAPGEDLTAFVTVTGANAHGVIIRTASETALVWSYGGDSPLAQKVLKANGASISSIPTFGWVGQPDHKSWQGGRLLWSVRVYTARDVGVLVNGKEVARFALTSDITEAGFGIYGNTAQTGLIQYVSRQVWRAPMRLLIIGDSLSQPAPDFEWASFAVAKLSDNYAVTIDNRASPGQRADQQLAALQSAGVNGATHAVVFLGVNNQRQATAVASFYSDIGAILDILNAAGVKTVVAIPHAYFTQDVAGVATNPAITDHSHLNDYAEGAPYRAALFNQAGAKGARVYDLNKALGPVLASIYLATGGPVGDGAHLVLPARKIIGEGFADELAQP